MSKIVKGLLIGIGILVILYTCSDTKGNNSTGTTKSKATEASQAEQKWTEVYTFKGNGMKKSPAFKLTGNEARLKYSYKSKSGIGMGMFSVYVVDEGQDIMKQGGIPEVMTQAENEESESALQKSEGRYYLHVNATGDWVVVVEELK
jgi:hypothetical protein